VEAVLKYLAGTTTVPLVVELVYREGARVFAASIVVTVAVGLALERLHPEDDPVVGPREVLEFEPDAESVLVGRPIAEAVGDLPDGVVIGSASRSGELVTPRGQTELRTGDHVVVFAEASAVDAVVEAI
jgi:NhaP-type Na+/H+ and K+/H+ antiporter